jgi:hypothetical protein
MDKLVYKGYDSEAKELVFVSDKPEVLRVKIDGSPNGGTSVHYSEGQVQAVLKNVGSSSHPSGLQEFNFTYERIGRRVFMDGRVRFGPGYDPGGGGEEFWIDIDGPAEILPDFTQGSIESAGVFHGYGGGIREGNAYWSTNVGSGLDGIRLTYKDQHVSKSYPVTWGGSMHWRIFLSWRVP